MTKVAKLLILAALALYGGECYFVTGRAGVYTPVPPHYIRGTPENLMVKERKSLEDFIEFPTDRVYFGCYKTKERLLEERSRYDFRLRDERVVLRRPKRDDLHLIVPKASGVELPADLDAYLDRFTPQRYLRRFPKRFYGDGIEYLPLANVPFIPLYNLYELAKYYRKHGFNDRMLILYDGVYSLERLAKQIADPSVIKKVGPKTYEINTPIYIAKTASLVIDSKEVRLQSSPKPVVIIYAGGLYIKNSSIVAWDKRRDRYHTREDIPKEKILLIGVHRPRPYLLGFSGSVSYFVNSAFKGLGFHSTSSTFGISFADLQKPDQAYLTLLMMMRQRYESDVALIGNDFSDIMIGFFSNHVDNAVVVGNYYHDNIIYDIDPHDFGKNLVIARNVTSTAKLAHGIVLSREITDSLIAQNVVFGNGAVGIMLDRSADRNIIYDNLVFDNGVNGITIQESDRAHVAQNTILHNRGDGILVRNSLATEIRQNSIGYNLKNGAEIFTKDIDDTLYRDFRKDPYHKATSAYLVRNRFFSNFYAEILSKNSAAVALRYNRLTDVVAREYAGDLGFFPEPFEQKSFTLYGMGYPYKPPSSDAYRPSQAMMATLEQIFCESDNPQAVAFLGELLLQRGQKSKARRILQNLSCRLDPRALYVLAFTYFDSDRERLVELLIQSAVMGHSMAIYDISFLPYFLPLKKEQINSAFERVAQRMERGELGLGCDLQKKERKRVINRIQYVQKLLELHNLDFYSYTKRYTRANKRVLTPKIIRKIEEDFRRKNVPKILHFEQLRKKELTKEEDPRKAFVRESLEEAWSQSRTEAYGIIYRELEGYLQKINRHRLRPLRASQLLGTKER